MDEYIHVPPDLKQLVGSIFLQAQTRSTYNEPSYKKAQLCQVLNQIKSRFTSPLVMLRKASYSEVPLVSREAASALRGI